MKEILIQVGTSEHINSSSKEYALYVGEQRAIPKAIDGLKSAQRKALFLMMTRGGEIKTVSLSGETISKGLYVHGDVSMSDTISLLAAPYSNNLPWLLGIGTFGTKVNPKAFAAPRYTYVKRAKHADEILFTDKDIIPMQENYDGSTEEPLHFIPIIPTVLLNGVSGIAVGWSTEILPRSVNDLIKATVSAIEGKKFKAPAPTYEYLDCTATNIEGNAWEFSGRVKILNSSTCEVQELPPDLTLEKFRDRLIQLEDQKIIRTFTDHSADKIRIEICFPRGALVDKDEAWVIKTLKLTSRKTERIVAVDWDNKSIRQFESAEQLIKEFVEIRFRFYVTRFEKLLKDDTYELNYWKGVKLCFEKGLPAEILNAKDKAAVIACIRQITKSCKLDDDQIEKIAGIASYNWAKDRYKVVQDRIKELEGSIKKYTDLLANHDDIRDIYRQEVLALRGKKFEVER